MALKSVKNYLSLVKISHTVFALPFAVIGFFLAVREKELKADLWLFLLILLCMVFARSAAMAFNRYIDRNIDRSNPRTSAREIPAGVIRPRAALFFVIISSLLFIATTFFIKMLAFYLSPVALLVVLGYSYTKRFTALSHFILGLGLSLAPIGAYLSVTGRFDIIPLMYSGIVFFWVGGFDIIYALQDEDFDRQHRLRSVPAWLGRRRALMVSVAAHVIALAFMVAAGILQGGGLLFWLGALVFTGLMIYQHTLVKPHDISKVNMAFAVTNGWASISLAVFCILDMYFRIPL